MPPLDRRAGRVSLAFIVLLAMIAGVVGWWFFRYSGHGHEHDQTTRATLRGELRRLVNAQDAYFVQHSRYASAISRDTAANAVLFRTASEITIVLGPATADGWSATAVYRGQPAVCGVFVGKADPPVQDALDGTPKCESRP